MGRRISLNVGSLIVIVFGPFVTLVGLIATGIGCMIGLLVFIPMIPILRRP